MKKKLFDKGSEERFSKGLYEVVGVDGNKFKIKNANGDVLVRAVAGVDLLKVDGVEKGLVENVERVEVRKEARVNRILRQDGLDRANKVIGLEKIE